MTTTPHAEETAFLAAICADPADDTTRLVYADWLDEHGETVLCPSCLGAGTQYSSPPGQPKVGTCPRCHGEKRVSDGRRERGEFIRVQCELARTSRYKYDDPSCDVCGNMPDEDGVIEHGRGCYVVNEDGGGSSPAESNPRYVALRARERELWNYGQPGTWVDRIKPPFVCIQCIEEETISRERARDPVLIYRRGFVSHITLTCADFLTHAAAIFACQPVTGVTLSGKRPHRVGEYERVEDRLSGVDDVGEPGEHFFRRWNDETDRPGRRFGSVPHWDLSPSLFDLLPNPKVYKGEEHLRFYPTESAALAALSAAAVTWARGEAGLPKLEGEKR